MQLSEAWDFSTELDDGIIKLLKSKEASSVSGGGMPCGMTLCSDWEYYFNHSDKKEASPLVEKLVALEHGEHLIDIRKRELAEMIWNRFSRNWSARYNAYYTEVYAPLENYRMMETVTPNLTDTRTPNLMETRTPDLTETRTPDVTVTRTPLNLQTETKDMTTEAYIKGFNSTQPQTADKTVTNGKQIESGSESTSTTGTDVTARTGSDTTVYSGNEQTIHSGSTQTERSGNIGVTTSQQMLQAELDLRTYDFCKSVYADIDVVLCCPLYI